MIEELAAKLLGVDADDYWDELDERFYAQFGIDLQQFESLADKLLPLCATGVGALNNDKLCGFADKQKGMWLMKIEEPQTMNQDKITEERVREFEPVAHMLPSDLRRFETSETYAIAYSVAVGNPDEGSLPLYSEEAYLSKCAEVRELRDRVRGEL